jgi:hypothetical protein
MLWLGTIGISFLSRCGTKWCWAFGHEQVVTKRLLRSNRISVERCTPVLGLWCRCTARFLLSLQRYPKSVPNESNCFGATIL